MNERQPRQYRIPESVKEALRRHRLLPALWYLGPLEKVPQQNDGQHPEEELQQDTEEPEQPSA